VFVRSSVSLSWHPVDAYYNEYDDGDLNMATTKVNVRWMDGYYESFLVGSSPPALQHER
jgi:hypothetical protein